MRGGKRKGAGRKRLPDGEKRITRSINLPAWAWEKLERKAGANEVSVSDVVLKWVRRLRDM